MANYTQLSDTLGGSEGKGFITRSGQNREMFEISKIDAHVTLTVAEKKLLGHRMKQHKVVGATGEGSGTFYFMNSDALKEFLGYKKNGVYPASTRTSIVVESDTQTYTAHGCTDNAGHEILPCNE